MLLYSLPPYLKGKALWANLSAPIRVLLQSLKFKVTTPLLVYIFYVILIHGNMYAYLIYKYYVSIFASV